MGAPPRLKIHIGGESLLNDGSAMVFFSIFSALFLYEMGIAGVGSEIDLAGGFALFFRMSLWGCCRICLELSSHLPLIHTQSSFNGIR